MGEQAAQPLLKQLDLALLASRLLAESLNPLLGCVEFTLAVTQGPELFLNRPLKWTPKTGQVAK